MYRGMVTAVSCPSCGAPLTHGALACPFCRVALSWPQAPAAAVAPAMHDEVVRHLRSGDKLMAIKAYHQANRCGLADAKKFVDELERKLGLA